VTVVLASPRLRYRELALDDYDAVHAYASDPEVVRYLGWGPNTEQDTRDFLERAVAGASAEPREKHELAVVTADDGRLVGSVGLYLAPADEQAMLGYCYHPDAWGRGLATEAAETMLDFGFGVLLLHRIWAGCDPDNVGSVRVLEKIGMTREGRLREATKIRGEFRDTLVYGLLAREWRARKEQR
jgi:ribosomal-protein-alanine N-acetyltransferase